MLKCYLRYSAIQQALRMGSGEIFWQEGAKGRKG